MLDLVGNPEDWVSNITAHLMMNCFPEYTVVMFDSKTSSKRWNATYLDYSSHVAPDIQDYGKIKILKS